MEKSIFRFIWKHSAADQIKLLLFTLAIFPVIFLSLELPKRIINDAIGGNGSPVEVFGLLLTQTEFLLLLCFGFLAAVLVSGLMKMRLNTMKGVLAERLLRRFRYLLLTRVIRYPRPYFRKTSQGELVSMVTSEAEPMGGLMGDFIAQPVFQAGQMLTILVFLFIQSFWFGLASIALIPLQAWLIPLLQRQINQLNKERIHEVRQLATDIGETAAGVSDLRTNGGLRYQMSSFSHRLGILFGIRFEIFRKKFLMKFLNNFINQLTPFFFYSVGGVLAINGEITVGALVAALAAYKDIASPWKELLAYYNQTQDMAVRWEIVVEKFAPDAIVDDRLFEGEPREFPQLNGDIELDAVTVVDADGNSLLEDISLNIPGGARVAIKASSEITAMAFADLLTREVLPHRGSVTVSGHALNELHQHVIGKRIGYAHSRPHIFRGSLRENLMMPFKHEPKLATQPASEIEDWQQEAARAGNSLDPHNTDWLDPQIAGFASADEIHDWWFQLVTAMGIDEFMVRRALRSIQNTETQGELIEAIVELRPEIQARLREADLDQYLYRFDPEKFNPETPLGSNLLYATPSRPLTQLTLSKEEGFINILREEGLTDELANMSASMIEGLTATFGNDGTDHPLFHRLNLDADLYHRLGAIAEHRRQVGDEGLPAEDFALLLTVPFAFSAEQIGPAFTDQLKAKVLEIRKQDAEKLVAQMGGLLERIDPQRYMPVRSLLQNAIFGVVSSTAGAHEKEIEDLLVSVLEEHGLRRLAAQSIFDVETTQGGENIPAMFRERIAFSRAGIKKPDILILANALASHEPEERARMRERISGLMPDATKIFIEKHFNNPGDYDLFVEIKDGRIDGSTTLRSHEDDSATEDLNHKLQVLSQAELFANLDNRQQRLLAFSAQWYKVPKDKAMFMSGEKADAAYLCVEGRAALYWPEDQGNILVTEVLPGRLIGDLSVILNQDRNMNLFAEEDSLFLRIGAEELMTVIENDAMVAASLLKTVGSHLTGVAANLRAVSDYASERGVDVKEYYDQRLQDERAENN